MRTLITTALVVILALASAVFVSVVVNAFFYAPDEEIEAPLGTPEPVLGPEQHPVRMRIPALGIDADVQQVGVTESGAMATPSNFQDVGWYKYGVAPGGDGSAVIAGHVDNGLGLAGVFKRLHELAAGDEIFIERADGSEVRFVVTGSRSYPYEDTPTEVLFNPSGSPRLNLITCEGTWLSDDRTYDQRLIVFAELAGIH